MKYLIIIVLILILLWTYLTMIHYRKEAAYWEDKYTNCQIGKDFNDINHPPSILEQ